MATHKIYLETGAVVADATITEVHDEERKWVRLDRTIFHPQGGGQRADIGMIGACKVLDVRHGVTGEVDHFVDRVDDLKVGGLARLVVDPEVRCLHARFHSAGHLIADAAIAVEPDLVAKTGHHWPGQSRVEFEGAVREPQAFAVKLQDLIAAAIADDLPVTIVWGPNLERGIRIGGGGLVGCGGTHVASLAELGAVGIRKIQLKNGVVRVSYTVDRARRKSPI